MKLRRIAGQTSWQWAMVALASVAFLDAAPVIDTPREPVTQTYHGVVVTDDYQWLANTAVRHWTAKENAVTQAYFEGPSKRLVIVEEIRPPIDESSAFYSCATYRAGRIFAMRFKPPQ